ncbi:PilZ domain-containing protein [Geopsychrobacter electrodiphilus]|uniref:PilZ domain-containing protein n=1 Tax=Geopsychrobacter electrodiphilus TaxID=225196 RepID=UPI00037C032A|nr:PilZ domain-containing protein [Geopsychrobacter electrodiphilus]
MIYQRYFKTGQRVQLRAKQPLPTEGRNELLSAKIESGDTNYFDLSLPYGPNAVKQYAFHEDMQFELSADAMGLGVRVSVNFLTKLEGNLIRVLVLPDLQMFQRRAQPRIDCTLDTRFTLGKNSFQKLRTTWEKNASILVNAKTLPTLHGFTACQLNISSSGIRFSLHPPADPTDICLMLINLNDGNPPICALAEIVWVTEPQADGTLTAGMQFINIMDQDQKRIERFIKDHS